MLEAGRVSGVTGDGNADILELHDSNALGNVICAVALNVRARTLGVCGLGDDLYRLGVRIKLGSYIGKAVDARNDHSGILTEAVEDNAEGLYADLVCVKSDLDSALCSCKGLVTCEEAEALGLLGEKHLTEVTVTETDLAVLGNRAGNAEGLESLADSGCSVCCLGAALLDSDSCAYGVCPYCVLEADRLCRANDIIAVDTLVEGDLLALVDRGDTVFFQCVEDLSLASFITFKLCHCYLSSLYQSLRGSMYLTASSKRPYVPFDFSYASFGSMPPLIKSVILPRETNSYPIT